MKSYESVLIGLLLAVVLVSSIGAEEPRTTGPGEEASLALSDLDGRPRDLGQFRGRIVVLNFWATWCLPCRDEMPVLAAIRRQYGSRGVEVVAASTDDDSALQAVRRFARRQKLDFPVWVGATTLDMQRFGLGDALPATALIDPDGSIAFRFMGVVRQKDLSERIEYLLGVAPGRELPALVNTLPGDAGGGAPPGEHDHEAEAGHAHDHGGGGDASLVPS